ncbi:NAD(P)H-hydrate dehydratase [Dinghuibacter silviterrae]|uniref:Bifunctional NAD(P)H-hydrate repair enzyme n=1 Tax=Dinghuibacter silviterrae TaxID=1539049 RepID=A0A4R8DH73_9BACT|nr:NAD(P)H-hydrate dehydratase [Dinghuibacter silviterrae]TDW97053.1 NAD(P)H-hydrate epimerase [Dinghuibacter silviterrae]
MKVYTGQQIRAWDAYTIAHEPISSLQLMERAAVACCHWITTNYALKGKVYYIFCAKGNNGGDGLALARLLLERHIPTQVFILEFGNKGTEDFQANLSALHALTQNIMYIQGEDAFPTLPAGAVIVDALLGSGLNRPLEGLTAALVRFLNGSGLPILAIDLPTGLRTDEPSTEGPSATGTGAQGASTPGAGAPDGGAVVIRAAHTLTLGAWKLGLLLAENAPFFGEVHLLPIGLHPGYEAESRLEVVEPAVVAKWYRPRPSFGHKGTFGHALLVAGGEGKMGACILSARACLHSGVGLTTVFVPHAQVPIVQTAVPEAMALADLARIDPASYKALGIGPGMGTDKKALDLLERLLVMARSTPLVLDADALTLLGNHPHSWKDVPEGAILTPHPKEFERLFGPVATDFERLQMALEQAVRRQCVIVLKGHRTLVAGPDGSGYFNTTGNAGMATGGSGDVLTGILTSLLAQGYPSFQAAVLGVYLHGLAGDLALDEQSMESLTASGIVDSLGKAFKHLGSGHI